MKKNTLYLLCNFKTKKMEKTFKMKVLPPIEIVNNVHGFMKEHDDCKLQDVVNSVKMNAGGSIKSITKNLIGPLILEFKKLQKEREEEIAVSVVSGMYLQDEPFIPEYIGFEEVVIDNENGLIRMYKSNGFVLMRNNFENIEAGKDKWVVTKNTDNENLENLTSVYTFKNMLHAVVVLESLGFDTSIIDAALAKDL